MLYCFIMILMNIVKLHILTLKKKTIVFGYIFLIAVRNVSCNTFSNFLLINEVYHTIHT